MTRAELHRGRCDSCRWVGRKLSNHAAAANAAARHALATGHSTRVTVDSWADGFRRDTVVAFRGVTR